MKVLKIVLIAILISLIVGTLISAYVYRDYLFGNGDVYPETQTDLTERVNPLFANVYVIADPGSGPQILSLHENKWDTVIDIDGTVIDYLRSDSYEVASIIANERSQLVFRPIGNANWTTVSSNSLVKRDLAISSDEQYIAFAEQVAAGSFDYNVITFGIENGNYNVVAEGKKPQFFKQEGTEFLAFQSDQGLGLTTVGETYVAYSPEINSDFFVDSDGEILVARNSILNTFNSFSVTIAEPLILEPLASIETTNMRALHETAAFGLNGNRLEAYDVRSGEVIATHDVADYYQVRSLKKQ